jgi:hypothetical protein
LLEILHYRGSFDPEKGKAYNASGAEVLFFPDHLSLKEADYYHITYDQIESGWLAEQLREAADPDQMDPEKFTGIWPKDEDWVVIRIPNPGGGYTTQFRPAIEYGARVKEIYGDDMQRGLEMWPVQPLVDGEGNSLKVIGIDTNGKKWLVDAVGVSHEDSVGERRVDIATIANDWQGVVTHPQGPEAVEDVFGEHRIFAPNLLIDVSLDSPGAPLGGSPQEFAEDGMLGERKLLEQQVEGEGPIDWSLLSRVLMRAGWVDLRY